MKKDIHPKYQQVLFVDSSTGHKFLCGTTLQPKQTEKFEGKEYPVCHVSISSSSHPYFTGNKQLIDVEGRVDKFNKRYSAAAKKQQEHATAQQEQKKAAAKPAAKKEKPKKA